MTIALASTAGCSDGESSSGGERAPLNGSAKGERAAVRSIDVPDPDPVTWHLCPEIGEQVECGTIEVPLDYSEPDGEQIELAVSRIPATSDQPGLGPVVVNFGGPGASGLDVVGVFDDIPGDPETLAGLQRFDLIGFDPRGVGASAPVDCGDTTQLDQADYSPETEAEEQALRDAMEAFAAACEQEVGDLLPFVGTEQAALDVESIRKALDEDQLNLYGFSYGTELFGAYADQYPDRVRAAVLDGAAVPMASGVTSFAEQAASLEEQFDAFAAACDADAACAPRGGSEAGAAYDQLAERLGDDAEPTASQLASVAATALYTDEGQAFLRALLARDLKDTAEPVSAFWDVYTGAPDEDYATAAIVAINCMDYPWPAADQMFEQAVGDMQRETPRMGEAFLREFLPCAFWPVEGAERPVPVARGSAPILVVGSTGDPATPYAWAEELARSLDAGVLLTREGDGHTALGRSACIDDAIARYLVDGEPPADGTSCPTDA